MPDQVLKSAKKYFRAHDHAKALEASARALEAVTDHNCEDYWELQFLRAEIFRMRGDYHACLSCLEIPPDLSQFVPQLLVRLKMLRGYYLGMFGHYSEARQLLDEAEELATENQFGDLLLDLKLKRGMFLFFMGDYPASLKSYEEALEACPKLRDYPHANALAGIAKIKMTVGNYKEAVPLFEEALNISEEIRASYFCAILWSELGWCHDNLDDTTRAMDYYQRCEAFFRGIGEKPAYLVALGNIGNLYVKRREYPTAISYYQRAIEIARELDDALACEKWLKNLSVAYYHLGNPVASESCQTQAMTLKIEIEQRRAKARREPASA